jgi:hypothetical protein
MLFVPCVLQAAHCVRKTSNPKSKIQIPFKIQLQPSQCREGGKNFKVRSLLQNSPGQGTGLTESPDSGGYVAGRVPSRGALRHFCNSLSELPVPLEFAFQGDATAVSLSF